jgi:SET domain-containing protein
LYLIVPDDESRTNNACADDDTCINRATKMECIDDDCNCGIGCQNQRFQKHEFASVSVIKTEKKGYGLRANTPLVAHQFIFEYIGEVIDERIFRRRMVNYDDEGIKHFYFMSLTKDAFVDATKKGNLGRFCNHSCNPNCYVDKWIVGNKLRMGIFAERNIEPGEELVFNYNVDRYGADPQPCYCDEPNCTGFIGGKTQTERATKLSAQTIEALGISDEDGWDTQVAKRPKKKKGEDDEEYVSKIESRPLSTTSVTAVMSTLMQCKEKWISVKLLKRIQDVADDDSLMLQVIKFHGYPIMRTVLLTYKDDVNVVLQVLAILFKFPRITKNKIVDAKIEETMESLKESEDEQVRDEAAVLLEIWSTLQVGYRIPRRNPEERRKAREKQLAERKEAESRVKSEPSPATPTGPSSRPNFRSSTNSNNYQGGRPSFRDRRSFPSKPKAPLPAGWFAATDGGQTYYYTSTGETTWNFPTRAATPPPPKVGVVSNEQRLQEIIDGITKSSTPKTAAVAQTAAPAEEEPTKKEKKEPREKRKEEKWKSYSEEKQKKLYEATLAPHIIHVMKKYKDKLPHEELKRYAKEVR